jgi:hypothetical protein
MIVSQKQYTPPPEGIHPAVCVDVVDLGNEENQWGNQHKCRIAWELASVMEDGRRFTAQQKFTVSLHEKSSLYKLLRSWRGKPFTAQELAGFDLEKVIGAPCQLVITHEEKDGKVYGNITAIMKADAKNRLLPSGKYVRAKDREGYVPPKSAEPPLEVEEPEPHGPTQEEQDSVPF